MLFFLIFFLIWKIANGILMADPLISELQDKEQDHNRNKDDQWEEWKNIKGKRKEELSIKNDKENKNTNFLEEETWRREL